MMKISRLNINQDKTYFYLLVFAAICMPLSKFGNSISLILLATNWILELNFKTKWERLKSNKGIIVFSLVFFTHIVWFLNTQNFHYAFKDISNKVILLVYPIIIGTSRKITKHELKQILLWFSISVIISTLISTGILVGLINIPYNDIREISKFMSHIRLSLLIDFSIFSFFYMLTSTRFELRRKEKILYIIGILWLVFFLFLLKSFTGIVIFIIVSVYILFKTSLFINNLIPRLFLQVFIITGLLLIASYLTHSISKFYTKEIIDKESLSLVTKNGNPYQHLLDNRQIENGKYVWIYYCEKELKKEWNKRSRINFDSSDKKGQPLKATLARYLTSKGLKKDSAGVAKLNDGDIKNIENGMANYIFENKYAIYPKIYQAIWQVDVYNKGASPDGNSITQRVEYLKNAYHIIQKNFCFGVGTGDVKDTILKQYEIEKSTLSERWRLRAHNQYATFLLTFGVFGFLIVVVALIYPAINLKAFKDLLFTAFFLIVFLSFLNEDTLETQIGITFFSYFYSLFLFGSNFIIKKGKENV